MSAGAMVASVLGSMAALASMAVTLALCYLFWRKRGRAKDAKDELEPLQVQGGGTQQSNTPVSSNTPNKAQSRQQSPGKGVAVGAKGSSAASELSRQNVEDRLYQGTTAPSPSSSSVVTAAAGGKGASKDKMAASQTASQKDTAASSSTSDSMLTALIAGAAEYEMQDDDDDILEPAGQIQFSLEYDFYASTLVLRIIQGKDLPAKDVIGTSDPYVKVTLLPDKKRKLETRVKHRTLNPRWNETFYFEGFPLHKLQKSTLHLNVYDWDRFSRDDQIGEVFLPLGAVDLTQKPTFWRSLKPAENCKLGDLLVSLMYVARTSELTIGFMKARRLKAKDITGASDPYVKVWLMRGEKRLEKRKTDVHKATLNPIFEEYFTFIVPWEHIRETSMTVTVMDWDNVGRNEPIGSIILSSKSGPLESRHWTQMLNKPRTPVFQWHKLKAA